MSARLAVVLANLVAIALLAAALSYWGWRWFAPPPEPLVHAPLADVAAALAVSPPFGASAPTTLPTAQAVAPGNVRLLGVLAERDGRGQALLRMPDGTARLASAGDALGTETLVAVHPDAITLRDAGGDRRLALRSQPPPVPPGAARSTPGRLPSCVPTGYRGPVVRLNAELVSGLIAQPQGLAAVAEAKDGALVIRDEGGFAAMLGLRKGDRVTQANGIALRAPEDVIIAVLRPLAANQAVRVSGMRGHEPQELLIVNTSACTS